MSAHHHHTWYFQQDNDPAHRDASNTIAMYNNSRGTNIRLLANWPPHSPDLNLIENVWGAVQANLDQLGSKTFAQFKSNLIKLLTSVPHEWLVNAYLGMPKRVNIVISLKGDKLKHGAVTHGSSTCTTSWAGCPRHPRRVRLSPLASLLCGAAGTCFLNLSAVAIVTPRRVAGCAPLFLRRFHAQSGLRAPED